MAESDIFINADMGEGLGLHSFGHDETLMSSVDAINLACGFHAGDPHIMAATVELAASYDVRVGAHPGLPDLAGFGRRRMLLTPTEAADLVRYQVGALTGFLGAFAMPLNHIKPHGAFYGMLAADEELMAAVAEVNLQYGVPFFGLAGTAHETVCRRRGVEFIPELYVDLNYSAAGELIIQRKPEMADPEAVRERVSQAVSGQPIRAVDGTEITIEFQSVCVHSDAPNSPEVAAAVRQALAA
ncbi:5-oxoprolinase subunit PxpA [Nesterenkonia flava]|uniref:5-oxoprolinase subunit PxpA n=1 Tax=Nesterenkonia flava TaxID=469799 RepID=A0ABU1FU92_9MICC|nr:5-oxoprolinase subunit PxpA [Nesterenkonia flava]MDR5712234.1 5-oxoprolinase subunit PxpA [Nesterenkonia flava]